MSGSLRLLASWFRDAASGTRATRKDDLLIFPVVLRARIFCGLGAILFVPLYVLFTFVRGNPIYMRTASALIAIWLFHYWPWRVVPGPERNFQEKLLRCKEIAAMV